MIAAKNMGRRNQACQHGSNPQGPLFEPIVHLLSAMLGHRRHKFGPLILAIVRQSMAWRRERGEPLTHDEIVRLNEILLRLSIKIPELNEQDFLKSLHHPNARRDDPASPGGSQPTDEVAKALSLRLIGLYDYPPQRRGYEYERFLTELFDDYGLKPRSPFKLVGEQIDGSFKPHGETYLLEAKWHTGKTDQSDLLTFSGKVSGKATWSRGFFISNSGFSDDGLKAFSSGRRTNIICADRLDLHEIVHNRLSLVEILEEKLRRAAETNRAFVPVRELR